MAPHQAAGLSVGRPQSTPAPVHGAASATSSATGPLLHRDAALLDHASGPRTLFDDWLDSVGLSSSRRVLVEAWLRAEDLDNPFPGPLLFLTHGDLPSTWPLGTRLLVWEALQRLRREPPATTADCGTSEGSSGTGGGAGGAAGGHPDAGTGPSSTSSRGGASGGTSSNASSGRPGPASGGGSAGVSGGAAVASSDWGGSAGASGAGATSSGLGGADQEPSGSTPGTARNQAAQYVVADLDGRSWECSNRQVASTRVHELQGMMRVMDTARFLVCVRELSLDVETFFVECARYMDSSASDKLPEGHCMRSLSGAHLVKRLPVLESPSLMSCALRVSFPRHDYTGLSLRSFLHTPMDEHWGPKSTVKGRRDLREAILNLETYMTCFYHAAFEKTLRPLAEFLVDGIAKKPLLQYADIYIWFEVQAMLFDWAEDLRRNKTSAIFPAEDLKTAAGCAHLLSLYAEDLIKAATFGADTSRGKAPLRTVWETSPHRIFYGESSAFAMNKYPQGTAGWEHQRTEGHLPAGTLEELASGPPKTKQKKKISDTKAPPAEDRKAVAKPPRSSGVAAGGAVCGWTLAGLLGLVNKGGTTMGCSGKDCGLHHPKTLGEISLKEATEAVGDWLASDKLRNKALSAMLGVTAWRAA